MSSGVSQGSGGNNSVAEFEPTVDNGDQLTDCQMPPDTLVGDGTLLDGETIDHVTSKIRQSPYGQIVDFAVLRENRFGMRTCVRG